MIDAGFIGHAGALYGAANAATLRWMLARPALHGVFLNTKMNSITLADYSEADGARGPAYSYGWIQGRGLEALVRHARFYAAGDPALAATLNARAEALYRPLARLQEADGHAYFCYDATLTPVRFATGRPVPQTRSDEVFTYSDAFVAKGLVAAAARYAPAELPRRLAYLAAVIAAIEDDRFQMDEAVPLAPEAAAGTADFGPRMILLGAAELQAEIGRPEAAGFAGRFIDHILARHFDAASGLLANIPGEDRCNVGHAIEFAGFAMAWFGKSAPPALAAQLERILVASFHRGFIGPGVALAVSITGGEVLDPLCPWWSLPETIRTAALCHAYSGSADSLRVWQAAHDAFFGRYWRGEPAIAYQTLSQAGPVDYVPATPDLDPGYHTGLSLLAAIRAFGC
jgi:hypothetical protein